MNKHPYKPRKKALEFKGFQVYHGPVSAHCGHRTLVEVPEWLQWLFADQVIDVSGYQFSLLLRRWRHHRVAIWVIRISLHEGNISDRENIFISLHPVELIYF